MPSKSRRLLCRVYFFSFEKLEKIWSLVRPKVRFFLFFEGDEMGVGVKWKKNSISKAMASPAGSNQPSPELWAFVGGNSNKSTVEVGHCCQWQTTQINQSRQHGLPGLDYIFFRHVRLNKCFYSAPRWGWRAGEIYELLYPWFCMKLGERILDLWTFSISFHVFVFNQFSSTNYCPLYAKPIYFIFFFNIIILIKTFFLKKKIHFHYTYTYKNSSYKKTTNLGTNSVQIITNELKRGILNTT